MGVALVDIGAGTTDVAIFVEDAIWHTAVLPIGGNHLTNDLSIVLQVPFESAGAGEDGLGRALPLPGLSGRRVAMIGWKLKASRDAARLVSRRTAHEVIEARLEQLLHLGEKELRDSGDRRRASRWHCADWRNGTAARTRRPGPPGSRRCERGSGRRAIGRAGDSLSGPAFATGVGLARWGSRIRNARRAVQTGRDPRGRRRASSGGLAGCVTAPSSAALDAGQSLETR